MYCGHKRAIVYLFWRRLVEDHSLVRITVGPPLVLLHQIRDLYGGEHLGLLVLHHFLTSGYPLSSQNHLSQLPHAQLLHHCQLIRSSNHSSQFPKEDRRLDHGRTEMMEHHALVHAGVGQLKGASFQSPEQTSPVQKDRVDCKPFLVFW